MFDQESDYQLNWKAVFVTMGLLVVVIPTIYFVHRVQLGRVEKYLISQIEASKQSGDQEETIKSLNRFLVYRPDSPRQKAELTELFSDPDSPKLPVDALIPMIYQSIAACEQSPELEDKLPVLRQRLLENLSLALRAGEAVEQIDKLAKQEPDVELDKKLALIRYRNLVVAGEDPCAGRLSPGAMKWLISRAKMDPVDHMLEVLKEVKGDVELTAMLGNACIIDRTKLANSSLSKSDPEELSLLMSRKLNEMLERNADKPQAWLIDFQLLTRMDPTKAAQDIEIALEKFPEEPAILQQAAVHKMQRIGDAKRKGDVKSIENEITKAEEVLQKLRKGLGLRSSFTYASLSELALAKNQTEEAIEVIEDGLRVCEPPLIDLQLRLASIFNDLDDPEKALNALRQADDTLRQDAPKLNTAQYAEFSRAVKQQWLVYYAGQGNYVAINEQIDGLLSTTASSDSTTELKIQVFAADAFRKIGYWDKAANAYLKASALMPRNDELRRGAAESLVKCNRSADAVRQYELIQSKQPSDWMQLALLQMLMQTTDLSFDESKWKPIQTAIDRAREAYKTSKQLDTSFLHLVDVLEADLDVRKSSPSTKPQRIEYWKPKLMQMCESHPDQEFVLKNVVTLLASWGELQSAKAARAVLIEQNPNSLDAHLDHADELANSGKVAEALDYLLGLLPSFPANLRLNQYIVGILPIDDDLSKRVERLVDACGSNFSALGDLCEYLLRIPQYASEVNEQDKAKSMPKVERWNAAMQATELRLRKLEGERGPTWRYTKARRLLIKSLFDQKPDFSSVTDLIRQIEEVRPDWAYLNVLRGALSEQMKEPAKAIKAYQTAVSLSLDDIRVYERLIELLYQEGRFEEAESYITRLGNVSNQSNRIASVALRLSERNQASSLDVARRGTEARPLDPQAWIWYAKVLEISSRTLDPKDRQSSIDESEKHLLRARELDPGRCDTVRAMFQHYASTRQASKIEQLAESIESDSRLVPDHERWNVLGGIYLYLSKMDLASETFDKSLSSGGNVGTNSLLKAETMLRQGRLGDAIDFLTEMNKSKPEISQLRQTLAMMLSNRSAPEDWNKIEEVLTAPPFGNTVEDRLLHARLLMSKRSYADLELAREKLQAVAGVRNANSNEVLFTLGTINRYLLDLSNRDSIKNNSTRLYEEAADNALQQAALSMPPNDTFIAGYGSYLIERKRLDDASAMVNKLSASSPNSRATALIQALWNQAKGNQASARQAVLEWFARNAKVEYSQELDLSKLSPETLGFASAMFEAIEDQQGADRTFNAILDINPQIAKDYLKTLLRHDVSRLRNAGLKRLCGSLDELNLSPIDLSVMLSIISVLEFDKDKANDLVRLLAGKLEQSESKDMVALVATGDFFLAKKATKEALLCYKRIVQLEPKNPAALNNLANILIEVSPENAQEALGYIDQAVALIPDNAVLLDTKGTVLILLKRYDEAAQALSIATKKGGDPRSALHWYMALINAGKNQEANTVKQLIDKKTLRDVYLLPEDRAVLEKL